MFSDAFSDAFAHPLIQPAPIEDPPAEQGQGDDTGPWVREGVVHTGRKPNH